MRVRSILRCIAVFLPRVLLNLACFAIAIGYGTSAYSQTQTVTVDWNTRSITSPPISVNERTTVTVQVNNINDYLYSYNATVVAAGSEQPAIYIAAVAGPCADATVQAKFAAIDMKTLNPLLAGGRPASTTLQAFQSEYYKDKAFMDSLTDAQMAGCSDSFVPG